MRNNVLKIVDKSGNSFKLRVSTPTTKARLAVGAGVGANKLVGDNRTAREMLSGILSGDWKTVDKGFIRYESGKTRSRLAHNGDRTTRDLLILGIDGVKFYDGQGYFGMQLFEYEDLLGTNQEGEGFVIQPWVVNLTPGRIKWIVID